jgi:hypothetical protein
MVNLNSPATTIKVVLLDLLGQLWLLSARTIADRKELGKFLVRLGFVLWRELRGKSSVGRSEVVV